MNIYTEFNRTTARFVALVAMFTMLLSALPVHFFVAEAADSLYGPGSASLDKDANIFDSGNIDPTGYTNLSFSFDYNGEPLDDEDYFVYGWSDGSTSFALGTTTGIDEVGTTTPSDEISSVSVSLPAAAEAGNFSVYVNLTANSGSDGLALTNIRVWGASTACSPQYDVTGPTSIENTDTGEYFDTIQDAVDDCDTLDTHTIDVTSGTYIEDVEVDKELTLEGNGLATVDGQITVNAENVTINDFTLTNPDGVKAVLVNGFGNVNVTNNDFTEVGSDSSVSSNVHAFWYQDGASNVSNLNISGNTFDMIGHDMGRSATAIGVGDSTGSTDVTGVTISDNVITNVVSRHDVDYAGGGRGAYGILINHARSTDGGTTADVEITGNDISLLEGLWVHAIGLEGSTPNAVVTDNDISSVVEHKLALEGTLDGVGIFFEDNDDADTATISQNNFYTDGSWLGVAIHPFMTGLYDVDAEENYWNTTDETTIQARIYSPAGIGIDYDPWLCEPAPSTYLSVAGSCDTTKPTVSITSPLQAEIVGVDVTATGIASDSYTGIDEVKYTVTEIDAIGGSFVANVASGVANGTSTWDFGVSGLNTGFYRFKVQAFDGAGNSKYAYHDVEVDAEKPGVTIETPNNADVFFPGIVNATGTATDTKTSIDEVKYTVTEVTGIGGTYVASVASGVATGTEAWNFSVDLQDVGFYRLKVQAFDEDGNWRYAFHDVEVIEKPLASLDITEPATNGEILSETHTFEAEYVDEDNVKDVIRWAIRDSVDNDCRGGTTYAGGNISGWSDSSSFDGAHFEADVDMSTWADGDYCFVVNPDENASGDGSEFREVRNFELNNPEPIACVPGVNLLENPSFEEPDISGVTKKWSNVTPVAWIAEKMAGGISSVMEIHRGVHGWASSDGEQHAELATNEALKLSQTIDTIPGKEYTLAWDYSARPDTDKPESKMDVRINGSKVVTVNKNGSDTTNWKSKDYKFIADSSLTTISFEDKGNGVAGQSAFLDNTSLTCDTPIVPVLTYGAYCGDSVVGSDVIDGVQDWEQCEVGDEGCTDYCTWENQCTDLRLVKIDLEKTKSVSFNGELYLGSSTNPIPNNTWFNFDEAGDASYVDTANEGGDYGGLAVERDTDNDKLFLAFRGGNNSKMFDIASGTIETLGIDLGSIERKPNPSYKLDKGDIFNKDNVTDSVVFDMRASTGNDGVSIEIGSQDKPYNCPVATCNLTAEDSAVIKGNTTVLSWDVGYAASVSIDNSIGSVATTGSTTVQIDSDTTFTMTILDMQDEELTCSVTVEGTTSNSKSLTSSGSTEGGTPQVLGASTSQCSMYLFDYLKKGADNSLFETLKLQFFLLTHGYSGALTAGVFDDATEQAVKSFQADNSNEILQPWVDAGLMNSPVPTGFVYKTTRWKINDMVCPGSEEKPVF